MNPSKGWVTIFGSGKISEHEPEYARGLELGRLLAEAGWGVCTGGYGGIMEALPRGAALAGGQAAGVIIRGASGKPNAWIQTLHEEMTWAERLLRLAEIGNAYVVMDGGIGTLNEFFLVWEMANKKIHQKPIILLGQTVSQIAASLKNNPLVEFSDRPLKASTPSQVLAYLHEAF